VDFSSPQYWLTRVCFQRCLAFLYLIGFLIAANQYLALVGENGITPARLMMKRVSFLQAPGLCWFDCSDRFITALIWAGVALASFALTGFSERYGMLVSAAVWFLLWVLYSSLVSAGGVFYGFGWEMLLLEAGFLGIFLGSRAVRPPAVVMWLIVWVVFRVMFGAGLIKVRGDACWRDLTCMYYHYQSQPLPNPLSWYLHHLPRWFHRLEVLFNHFVELIVPFFLFAPRPICYWAGGLTILFQGILILSGNLSWLNYLTIVLCIPCFDDRFLARLFRASVPETAPAPVFHQVAVVMLAMLVLILSVAPVLNMLAPGQQMNASFDAFRLVNTYGAFGSITRERNEIVIEGTDDETPDATTAWREYEFKAKPGDVRAMPPIVSPYHYKIDWQMWFAAMGPWQQYPWFPPLLQKLLQGDKPVLSLLGRNPFPVQPPKYIRARLYRYEFTDWDDRSGNWWKRTLLGEYFPPVSLRDFRPAEE
jgi:hypothetical protein